MTSDEKPAEKLYNKLIHIGRCIRSGHKLSLTKDDGDAVLMAAGWIKGSNDLPQPTDEQIAAGLRNCGIEWFDDEDASVIGSSTKDQDIAAFRKAAWPNERRETNSG